MKVIGIVSNGKYICEVDHTELEKYLNLYYGKLTKLYVGQEVNLADGYDHYDNMRRVCENMESTVKHFKSAQDTMISFVNLLANKEVSK